MNQEASPRSGSVGAATDPPDDAVGTPAATGHRSGATRADADKPINDRSLRRLFFHSLVIAAAIPVLLRWSGGDPLRAAWSLTLFLISYLFFLACLFSTRSTPLGRMFFALSYGALLACSAGYVLGDVLGMVLIYLDSVLAAGWFGFTLAEHRESTGAEKAAAKYAHAGRRENAGTYALLGVMALPCAAWVLWVMRPVAGYSKLEVSANLLGVLTFFLFCCLAGALGSLNGGLVDGKEDDPFCFALWFATASIIVSLSTLVLGEFVGELVGVTVLWLWVLISTVCLGYCLRLNASSEKIIIDNTNNRQEPPLEDLSDYKVVEGPVPLLEDLDEYIIIDEY